MNCIICASNDWENVDEFRMSPKGMSMCKKCGMVSYPSLWKSPEEIKKYYRTQYRNPPSHHNVFTCQRKNNFHEAFLSDLFKQWDALGLKDPVIGEVGAAFGMALMLMKKRFPDSELLGTELTTSMRRVAYHEFGLELTEEFDFTKKYNLIMSYKVAEHQLDIDEELKKYRKALDPEHGFLYISVPQWFDSMNNFGAAGFDLEYYYDPNHINVWTRKLFEGLLKRVGFEIVKADHAMYDSTYLCRPSPVVSEAAFENPEEIKVLMGKIKDAYILFREGNYKAAIETYPNFPVAWQAFYEHSRREVHHQGWDQAVHQLIAPAIKACGDSVDILLMAADMAMRFEKFQDAEKMCKKSLEIKPKNPAAIGMMCNIVREYALRSEGESKVKLWGEAKQWANLLRETSLENYNSGTDMAFLFDAQIPTPFEG